MNCNAPSHYSVAVKIIIHHNNSPLLRYLNEMLYIMSKYKTRCVTINLRNQLGIQTHVQQANRASCPQNNKNKLWYRKRQETFILGYYKILA